MVFEALKGDQMLVELAQRYQAHPNQITVWKKQLLEHVLDVFTNGQKTDQGPNVEGLRAEIDWLSIENDFYPLRSVV